MSPEITACSAERSPPHHCGNRFPGTTKRAGGLLGIQPHRQACALMHATHTAHSTPSLLFPHGHVHTNKHIHHHRHPPPFTRVWTAALLKYLKNKADELLPRSGTKTF